MYPSGRLTSAAAILEPNNESPLNTHAAELWSQKEAYRKYLHEKYAKSQSSDTKSQ